jgi:hypothetical protein
MNERIQELMEEAGIYDFVVESMGINEEMEKFAELIVKECMAQIQQVREIKAGHAGPDYTQGFDDGMFVAISTIEEHFGVEE